MTQEEKAKAYDNALERARKLKEDPQGVFYEYSPKEGDTICDYIFPELNGEENEGERIRKALINYLITDEDNGVSKVGQIPIDNVITWLEKQGEQKTADEVEPKFHEGDWVVNKLGDSWHIDSFDKKNYQLSDGKGNHNYFPISNQNEMHLWTIQDAKEGDVLTWDDTSCVVLFKNIKNSKCFISYCFANDISFEIGTSHYIEGCHPATKEQRDTLFAKMKEAEYIFDFKNKELKKIKNEIEISFGAKDSELQEAIYPSLKVFMLK